MDQELPIFALFITKSHLPIQPLLPLSIQLRPHQLEAALIFCPSPTPSPSQQQKPCSASTNPHLKLLLCPSRGQGLLTQAATSHTNRAAVLTSSTATPGKAEQKGLPESGIHSAPGSSTSSSLTTCKQEPYLVCSQYLGFLIVCTTPCAKGRTYREPQQQHWAFEKASCRRGTLHPQALLFERCFQVVTALHVPGPITGSLVASQELAVTPRCSLPAGCT